MEDDVLHDSSISSISDINQLDGADSISSKQSVSDNSLNGDDSNQGYDDSSQNGDDSSESDMTDYDWDEEAFSAPIRAVLVPAPPLPGAPAGAPPGLTVDTSGKVNTPSCLPASYH